MARALGATGRFLRIFGLRVPGKAYGKSMGAAGLFLRIFGLK